MTELLEGLKKYFSFDGFLEGQDEVIRRVYEGEDICVVMPTGAGKSLCYQLPALVRPGYSVVISPLIALMKDQVDALQAKGISAEFINSTQTSREQQEIIQRTAAGQIKLLYAAPERMRAQSFRDLLHNCPPTSLVVDEAHCISQWGHDFRPDYTRLGEVAAKFEIPQICAFTATATPRVRDDIKKQLKREDMSVVVTGFARPNLSLRAVERGSKKAKLDEIRNLIAERKPTIIYCATRKAVDEVASELGVRAYHGGMSDRDRNDAQDYFLHDSNPVLAATNAFGMGIDRADIRQVIHYNFPGALEAYYQEVGRAGRDGEQSTCTMLFSWSDRYIHEYLIDMNNPDEQVIRSTWDTLRHLRKTTGESYFEMTLSELAEQVPGAKGDQQLSGVMKVLEKDGYIRRGFRQENFGRLGFMLNREELLEVFPEPKTQRAIFIHRVLANLGDAVLNEASVEVSYLQLSAMTGLKHEQLLRVLGALKDDYLDWTPPFAGRGFEVCLDEDLNIDFSSMRAKRESEASRLDEMISYMKTKTCRQDYMIRYFGQSDSGWRCGTCDNCGPGTADYKATQLSPLEVRHITRLLQVVKNFSGYLGLTKIAMLASGSRDASIMNSRLKDSDDYACLDMLDQSYLRELLSSLEGKGFVERTKDKYPTLKITDAGLSFLERPKRIDLHMPTSKETKRIKRSSQGEALKAKKPPVATEAKDLYDALRQMRNELAAKDGVEPWLVLSNASLQAIAEEKPTDLNSFKKLKGIGDYRAARYGKQFLKALSDH
jgi:ATP-dependent DNA helicase RecQ